MQSRITLAITLTIGMALSLTHLPSRAHEGHDHSPGSFVANHGGLIKPGKEINIEYVITGDQIKIYPTSHDGKDIAPSEVKLTATSQLPKGKIQPTALEIKEGAFAAKVDFKDSYRVEMKLKVEIKNKVDTFKIQIEK